MTKTEMNRFRAILTAKVAEPVRFTRHRDGIAVERSADQLDEIEAASQRALAVCKRAKQSFAVCPAHRRAERLTGNLELQTKSSADRSVFGQTNWEVAVSV